MLDRERDVALQAVRLAASVTRWVQDGPSLGSVDKKDKSPVTVADLASQAVICRMLDEAFPGQPIVAEEDSTPLDKPEILAGVLAATDAVGAAMTEAELRRSIDRGGASGSPERFWTLDPIDGTKGFLRREQYAVSLALIEGGQVVLGVLGAPNLPPRSGLTGEGTLLWAVRGQGAHQSPMSADVVEPISVSTADAPDRARLVESVESGHSSHDHSTQIAQRLSITAPPVRLDSQAKYAVVARGEAELYLRLPTRAGYREKIWDHAGGVIVLEEAGGRITDIHGRALDFTHGRTLANNRGVIASNGRFHDQVVQTVAEFDFPD